MRRERSNNKSVKEDKRKIFKISGTKINIFALQNKENERKLTIIIII